MDTGLAKLVPSLPALIQQFLVQDQDAHPEGKRICSFDSVISGSEISDIHSREDLRESSREVATPSQPP
jgi:hypothetical protein